MRRWTLDDIPWSSFAKDKVEPDLVAVIKAASLVERNAADYVTYLCNVFSDNAAFLEDVKGWGVEEIQHGDVLGRWAEIADPTFDYQDSFRRFREGYQIPVGASGSVRGSRAGELIARCVVETGTSSFYSALRDSTDEPVLKAICHRIAGDEFRHYKLFYSNMKHYQAKENLSRVRRAMVVLDRYREIDDDELAYAYHCANTPEQTYDRRRSSAAYGARAFRRYRPDHVQRAVGMMLKPTGFNSQGRMGRVISQLAWRFMQRYARRAGAPDFGRAGAAEVS